MGANALLADPSLLPGADDTEAPALEQGAADYGPNNKDLPQELQNALRKLVQHFAGLDKYARRTEVIEARRQRFYWRGDQYIWWNAQQCAFMPVTAGVSVSLGSDSVDAPRYTDVYNIFQPYGRSIVALLSQQPPGVEFEPDDPSSATDITAAEAAEKFKDAVDRAIDRKALQAEIARLFFTDDRVVLYTRYVQDAEKWGTNEDGEPNGNEVVEAFGVLEAKVPIIAKEQSQFSYLILADELDICRAKKDYPDAKDKIKVGTSKSGEDSYERMARLGVLQGTRQMLQAGDAYAHLVTRQRAWLRPETFEEVPDAVREELQSLFPSGCHVIFCGDAYCGSWDESMDDCIAVAHAMPGDGQARASWGKALVPIQDAFNDYKNMRKEYHDYGIPVTWMDKELGDINALREQVSEPGNHVQAPRPSGITRMQDAFFVETAAVVPADMLQAEEDLRGALAQFVTGALPALFGGDMPDQKTASGYAMARDQAMGVMGLVWGSLQEVMAKAYKQAIIAAAKHRAADDVVHVRTRDKSGQVTIESIAIGDLQKGSFHCYPEQDSSFPETFAAKRNTMMQLWTAAVQNPVLLEMLMQPDNLELTRETWGLDELEIPGADARNKQTREIEQLLREVPIPDPAAAEQAMLAAGAGEAAGLPTAPPNPEAMLKPSVEVDPVFDLHKFEFETGQRWWNSPERAVEQQQNSAGVENVRLHLLEHFKYMQAAAAAAMPPPTPAPSPGANA